jgi:hypothetical protein
MSYTGTQLAFHLPFDEPTGINIRDDGPENRNFTLEGYLARETGPYLYPGLYGYTGPYTFTGASQCTGLSIGGQGLTGTAYIQANSSTTGDVSTGDFCLACWIAPRWSIQTALLNNYNICSKYPDEFFPYFEFGLEDDTWYCYTDFFTNGHFDGLFTQNTHTLRENSWMHIAFTVRREPSGILTKFYMNGILHNSSMARGPHPPYNTKSLSNDGKFKIFKVQEHDVLEFGHHLITDFWFFNNYLLSDSEVYNLYKVLG